MEKGRVSKRRGQSPDGSRAAGRRGALACVNGVEVPWLWTARWIGYDGTGIGQGLPIPVTEAEPMVVAGDTVRAEPLPHDRHVRGRKDAKQWLNPCDLRRC
ncbi:hypothetical protein NSPZN2_30260 [Nitrospira defluvii]|uniref:Uncharacterized protein n=1 Tax=Nitrospira defluvii TaxID=330214 RepID=A0ABM8RHG7_9BACT|nr:hypothetical protein NSPZN2_30260 [Nitrospira defluvii]